MLFTIKLFGQQPFHRDSLRADSPGQSTSGIIKDGLGTLMNAIVRGDYQPYGPIEYIPETALDLTSRLLPQTNVHPRLLTENQINFARSKLGFSPYADWFQLLLDKANRRSGLPIPRANTPVVDYAEDVKNLAWLYRLTGQEQYLELATILLKNLPEPPQIVNLEGGRNSSGWGDYLLSAQALPALWIALDLLWDEIDQDIQFEVRRKLTVVAQQLAQALWYTPANNHVTLMAVAVLTTAIAEDETQLFIIENRNELWRKGIAYLSRSLGLIAPDGGYAEGVYYANYILAYLAPLSVYWENATGDRLFSHPYLERMVDWVLANDKNSGAYSGFDDAFQIDFFYLPLFLHQSGAGAIWRNYLGNNIAPRENLVEAMAVYRSGQTVHPADLTPATVFADYGQVIFRDKEAGPDRFASFLVEDARWFSDRHEHIDPLSFELSAFGTDLIVDAGYGGGTSDPNRQYYLGAEAHNGLLVNGRGAYRNPQYGDSLAGRLLSTFLSRSTAGAVARHSIAETDFERSFWFLDRRFFLIVDSYEEGNGSSIALNFNHTGNISSKRSYWHRITRDHATLDLITLNSEEQPLSYHYGNSLVTTTSGIQGRQQFQVEAPTANSGAFVTLMMPSRRSESISVQTIPKNGRGEVLRIEDPEGENSGSWHLAINRGGYLESEYWKSDASVLLINSDDFGELKSVYMEKATTLFVGQHAFTSALPITVYMEKQSAGWAIFVKSDRPSSNPITLEGFGVEFARWNRRVIPFHSSDQKVEITIAGSGILLLNNAFLPVPQVQKALTEPDLIAWLASAPDARQRYASWSEREQKVFENQSVSAFRHGFTSGLRYWSNRLTNNEDLPFQIIDVSAGVGRASYDRDAASTYSLRFPHQFELRRQIGQYHYAVTETGEFSLSDWETHYLAIDIRGNAGKQLRWLSSFPYQNSQTHQVFLQPAPWINGSGRILLVDEKTGFDTRFYIRRRSGYLAPGYSRSTTGLKEAFFLSGGYSDWEAYFAAQREGDRRLFQPRLGYHGRDLRFTLQSNYDTEERAGGFSINSWYRLRQGVAIYPVLAGRFKSGEVTSDDAWVGSSWRGRKFLLRGEIGKRNGKGLQRLDGHWHKGKHSVAGGVTFSNTDPIDDNLYLKWRVQHAIARMQYEIRVRRNQKKAIVPELRQQLSLPIGRKWYTQFYFSEYPLSDTLVNSVGVGGQYSGAMSFYLQAMHQLKGNLWQADFFVELYAIIPFLPAFDFAFSGEGDALQAIEVRAFPIERSYTPGLFYRYMRDGLHRLEGFLEWRW